MFLFANKCGASTLFDHDTDYANFEKLMTSKHALKPEYYKTQFKIAGLSRKSNHNFHRTVKTSQSKRSLKHMHLRLDRPKSKQKAARPKTSRLSIANQKDEKSLLTSMQTNSCTFITTNPDFKLKRIAKPKFNKLDLNCRLKSARRNFLDINTDL